jgi:hypothetical protein
MALSLAVTPTPLSDELRVWGAHANLDIGVLIHAYLSSHPAPGDSDLARCFATCAEDLQVAGRTNLGRLGSRPLVAVAGGDA